MTNGIARQQWRARIETGCHKGRAACREASPASNGGRGLKRYQDDSRHKPGVASPASNGGRGLKRKLADGLRKFKRSIARQQWRARIETRNARPPPATAPHRPPAMAGAD